MDAKYVIGRSGKVIFARVLPNSELIASIKKICQENSIEIASIGACIGSLKEVNFVYAMNDASQYYNIRYSDEVKMKGAIEFLSAQGIVSKDNSGLYQVHMHALFSDESMKVFGGHLLNEGNIVLATIDLVLNEILDISVKRNYHQKSGFYFFEPNDEE
ncbi:MAG: DUF296 domain-containing protein [Clostridiales bacterium]|nr:DUF296 domain-containing protein [Clostridiales bacterium]